MKDNDKVELTVGNIKAAAEKCGTAKEVLKELFPEVFEGRWEKMDLSDFILDKGMSTGASLCLPEEEINPFNITLSDLASGMSGKFKVEDGKLWRRKKSE